MFSFSKYTNNLLIIFHLDFVPGWYLEITLASSAFTSYYIVISKRIFEILDTCKHGDRKLRARFLKFVIAFSLFLNKSEFFL